MMASEIASSYSKALYHLSIATNQLEVWLKDIHLLSSLLCTQRVLSFFSSPQISLKEKEALIQKVLGNHIDHNLLSFLKLLIKKDEMIFLSEILEKFRQRAYEKLELMDVHLVTTTLMDPLIEEKLKLKLENLYKKKIVMTHEVDPNLIGGGVLKMGNQIIDFSIKNQLNVLKQKLLTISL